MQKVFKSKLYVVVWIRSYVRQTADLKVGGSSPGKLNRYLKWQGG